MERSYFHPATPHCAPSRHFVLHCRVPDLPSAFLTCPYPLALRRCPCPCPCPPGVPCGACMQLASFQDLLRTQTEVVLSERLSHDFARLTADVKESKRRLDKRSGDYDAARLKHLGHRWVLRGSGVEGSGDEFECGRCV